MFKSFFSEFKKFAMKGNVIDLAIGIIIGGAFGKIVNSLVTDIIMPPIGLLLGNVDFSNLYIMLKNPNPETIYSSLAAAQQAGAVTLNIGLFINAIVTFTIVAFAVFILVKAINSMQKKEEEKEKVATTKECPFCFTTININATRCPYCTSEIENKK